MDKDALSKINGSETTQLLYSKLLEKLNQLGEYEVETKQTSLHITHGRAFLGVHPRKDALLLNVVTSEPIVSERLKKTERVSANRYHNELIVSDVQQYDDELLNWLTEAYQLTVK